MTRTNARLTAEDIKKLDPEYYDDACHYDDEEVFWIIEHVFADDVDNYDMAAIRSDATYIDEDEDGELFYIPGCWDQWRRSTTKLHDIIRKNRNEYDPEYEPVTDDDEPETTTSEIRFIIGSKPDGSPDDYDLDGIRNEIAYADEDGELFYVPGCWDESGRATEKLYEAIRRHRRS